jgi:hypothetical protein
MTTPDHLPSPPRRALRRRRESEEFEFCATLAARTDSERRETHCRLEFRPLDWNEFLRLAEHHGVLPLVAST